MKGGSREAKELKRRGGENMLRETGDSNPPPPPPPPPPNSFLEFRFKENVSILEQIMSAVKYPCIFPRQIENIVYLATSYLVNS